MIIAGAGGHAVELLDIMISLELTDNLFLYDDLTDRRELVSFPVLKSLEEAGKHLLTDSGFILGIGNPQVRGMFYREFLALGGKHHSIKGKGLALSHFTQSNEADIFNLCFIGANIQIGKGTLINTGAQIHHDVKVGEFSEVNPEAVLLGA